METFCTQLIAFKGPALQLSGSYTSVLSRPFWGGAAALGLSGAPVESSYAPLGGIALRGWF